MAKYIMVLDQGTTSSRTIIFTKMDALLSHLTESLNRFILSLAG